MPIIMIGPTAFHELSVTLKSLLNPLCDEYYRPLQFFA